MKKSILMSAAAAALILVSCSNEHDGEIPNPELRGSVAYVSIKVDAEPRSRASSEVDGSVEESTTKTLYLITFNEAGAVMPIPGSSLFYTELSNPNATPGAVKISSSSKNLVVIANPGTKLKGAIIGLNAASTFSTFNAVVSGVTTSDIKDTDGTLTMITAGDATGKTAGGEILNPYVNLEGKIIEVAGEGTAAEDAAAKAEAELAANRLEVRLERLAAKLEVKKDPALVPDNGATFNLTNWTVDAVNGTYYPFAKKNLLSVTHTTNGVYAYSFYTEDPNYTNNTGIVYGKVDADSFLPILPWGDTSNLNGYYGWKAVDANDYVIENTMAASEQKVGYASRIVIKATYFPKDFTAGADWFSWKGVNYESLAKLKVAYQATDATAELKEACKSFYKKIKAYKNDITGADFLTLTEADLAAITPGGEVVKDGQNQVIFWYKGGACYYYYEIRHDNSPNASSMAFAKYGVVRNNWYKLTLNKVKRPGTPWYPDLNNPGPGDPGIGDPIDDKEGYLGVDIKINPWILFETNFEI